MDRAKRLGDIIKQFDSSAKQFSRETGGLFCEISSQYKGPEKLDNLKYRFAKIYYHSFIVEFIYTSHGFMGITNSILGCSIYLDKREDIVGIPLQLASDYCDVNIDAPLCIPLITNSEGMQQAFGCILNSLKMMLPIFKDVSCHCEAVSKIWNTFTGEMKSVFDIDISEDDPEMIRDLCHDMLTLRFSSDAFISYIKGNTKAAIKRLKKIKKLTGYEKRMIELWSMQKSEPSWNLSVITKNAQSYNDKGVPKANFREFTTLFLSWMILTPVISVIYIALYFFFVYLEGRHSLYLMGPVYNFPFCIVFGFVTSIAVSYFTRRRFYKWFHKKDYDRFCEMDDIQNGAGSDKLMKGFLVVLVTVSVAALIFLAKWNLNFKADGFVDNSSFFSLNGQFHAYSEVQYIYYKPDRINGLNVTLSNPSYVMVLRDGTQIDFYDFDEITNYENELLEYLSQEGIEIISGG